MTENRLDPVFQAVLEDQAALERLLIASPA